MKNMLITSVFSIVLTTLISGCGGGGESSNLAIGQTNNIGYTGDGEIENLLSQTIEKYNIPAIGVLTIDKNGTVEKSFAGEKIYNQFEEVTNDDLWNIGSVTKSMTSTLVAIMIDKGFLNWTTTLEEVFPEFSMDMKNKYKTLTLKELLSHTSGFPADSDELWQEYVGDNDNLITQRYDFTYEVLMYENEDLKGDYLYSNINYVVVAAVLEKISGLSFEELIQTYLFDELNMTNTQIGTNNLEMNIQGHIFENFQWKVKKIEEVDSDNVEIVAPAGSQTYVSLDDMAKYLKIHLQAKMDLETNLMSKENFDMLHKKIIMVDNDLGYALGWFTENDYGLQHSGSNGRWFSLAFINKNKGFAYFVIINAYDIGVEQIVYEMMHNLVLRSDALNIKK